MRAALRALRVIAAVLLVLIAHPAVTVLVVIGGVVALRDSLSLGLATALVVAAVARVVGLAAPGLARVAVRAHRRWTRTVMAAVRALIRPRSGARRGSEERPGEAARTVRGGEYQ